MEMVFESILLFSLAILVIAIGLLVYYFKKRITDIEQKNTKCLEIVQDVFVQHMQLKAEVAESRIMPDFYQQQNQDDRIKIHLEENYDAADDDAVEENYYADTDDEADDTDDVKIVNVDLSGPIVKCPLQKQVSHSAIYLIRKQKSRIKRWILNLSDD